jgi:hypothetical protein
MIAGAKIKIAPARLDIFARNWTSAKEAVDAANNALKQALRLDLNDIEQHQISLLDLFNNPVGYRTSPGKMLCILLFLSGCCLKTEVIKQLY